MMAKRHIPFFIFCLCALGLLFSTRSSQKTDFDLIHFGRLPVLEGGRLKPLDTVARNSLLMLRGKQTIAREGKRMSALEWLADVMTRSDKADAYKVFVINDPDVLGILHKEQAQEKYFAFNELGPFLDALQSQAARAQAVEGASRSRYQGAIMNLYERVVLYQRLKNTLQLEKTKDFPAEIETYEKSIASGIRALEAHQRSGAFNRQALFIFNEFFEQYRFLSQVAYFRPLAPLDGPSSEEWLDMGEGLLRGIRDGAVHSGVKTYALLARSYQSGDKDVFNATLAGYTDWLELHFPKVTSCAKYEAFFNQFQPFYKGILLYLVVLLLSFLSWLVYPEVFRPSAFYVLLLGFSVHTAGLLSRILLQGRPPVTNLYSSAIFVGWVAVLLGIVLERLYRKGIGNVVAGVIGSVTLIIAHHLANQGDTMEMMRAVLDSNFWLATHVVTVTIGYGSTFLAGTLAHVYILRGLSANSLNKETTKSLVGMTYGIICFSLLFSFVGTVLGGIWADQSWGRFWGWDPKENGALLIVLWNALILHARWGKYVGDRGVMVMAVFGNIVTSLSWFGVNMLGVGLHSYGFMDKAFLWLTAFILIELGVMVLGSLPRRFWRSKSVFAS